MEQQSGVAQRPLTIRWIVDSLTDAAGKSTLASVRYRVLLPAHALNERGQHTDIVRLEDLRQGHVLDWQGVDVLVVAKLFLSQDLGHFAAHSELLLGAARDAQAAGVLVVADVNDAHFEKPLVGQHWMSLTRLADVCIVGSETMGRMVQQHTDRPVVPVGDPIASPKGAARVHADRAGGGLSRLWRGQEPLRLVWYGAKDNLPAMAEWAMFIGAAWRGVPLQFSIVMREHRVVDELCAGFNQRFGPRSGMAGVVWSEAAQWAAVEAADIVMIPSDPGDPRKAVKTANRLVDALHAGRYVIASPIPSYLPYASQAVLTTNPVQAMHAYLDDPAEARQRIVAGQAAVERDWGIDAVASLWLSVLRRRG